MLLQAPAELVRLEIGLPGTFKDTPWRKIKNNLISTWLTDLFYFFGDNHILLHDPLP